MSRHGFVRVLIVIAVVIGVLAPVGSNASTGTSTAVAGRWVNGGCALTSYDLTTGEFSCVGTSDWVGTWTGVTTFTVQATLDVATGDEWGSIDETFIGVAADGSAGTLHFDETFTVDGSTFEVQLEFRIIEGTGEFEGSRGSGTFDGTVVETSGFGSFSGHWVRPPRKPR